MNILNFGASGAALPGGACLLNLNLYPWVDSLVLVGSSVSCTGCNSHPLVSLGSLAFARVARALD